jgi:Protein of unknown function (DUF2905)
LPSRAPSDPRLGGRFGLRSRDSEAKQRASHTVQAFSGASLYQLLEFRELLHSISLMQDIGRIVMIVGIVLAIGGALLWKFPGWFGWIGRLPGDISIQKGNFSFFFPLVTCILISVILTLLSWLFRR